MLDHVIRNPPVLVGKCCSHLSCEKKAPQAEVGEEQKKKDLVSSPRGDNTIYLNRVFILYLTVVGLF